MNTIKIGNRIIGEGQRPYFIADIGANHDGDINRAFMLIEKAKEAGADVAKFQNFKANKIVSNKGFSSLSGQLSHQASWKKPVVEVYKDASISYDWTEKIKQKCNEVGIEYCTSPYDFESVDRVDPYLRLYKIGSGDITWLEIIKYIAKKRKPVMIATGASSMKDVVRAMNTLKQYSEDIVLMQCNTNYSGSTENFKHLNLNVLKTYHQSFPKIILGLSDHTSGHAAVLGAIALGATVIEKHFTDDNNRIGPDHKFAMNPKTWRDMVNRSYELYYALGDGVKRVEENEKQTVIVQRRSLRYVNDITKGDIVKKEDIFPLRPVTENGFAPYEENKIIGKIVKRDVKNDDPVLQNDFEI